MFEEASWHSGEMVPSAAAAYEIMGYNHSVSDLPSLLPLQSRAPAVGDTSMVTMATDMFSCEAGWYEINGT